MGDQRYRDTIRAANASLYGATRAAIDLNHPNAEKLRKMALDLDAMVDALPPEQRAA